MPLRLLLTLIPPAPGGSTLALALREATVVVAESGWCELRPGAPDRALRYLNDACRCAEAAAIVLAEQLGPLPPDAPYRRLTDRTEALADALAAWRGGAAFPPLEDGDIVRLPV